MSCLYDRGREYMKCEEVWILEFTNEDDCGFLQVGVVGYSGSIRGNNEASLQESSENSP